MTAKPVRVLFKDGTRVYDYSTPYRELARVVESARRRGDEKVRIDGRVFPLDRIKEVLDPQEVTQ